MKICKRIALIVIMLILTATLNVYAGVTEIVATASATQAKVGETVTITLTGKCGTGIEGIDSTLVYDTTKLKLTNESTLAATDFTSMSGTNDSTGEFKLSVLYTGSGNAPQQADFATLTFEILDGANANETLSIKLSDIELGDSNDDWTELDDQTVTIKVLANETSDTNNNTTNNTNNNTTNNTTDNTTADGEYGYAGLENMVFVFAVVAVMAAIGIYSRINKYKDIK